MCIATMVQTTNSVSEVDLHPPDCTSPISISSAVALTPPQCCSYDDTRLPITVVFCSAVCCVSR